MLQKTYVSYQVESRIGPINVCETCYNDFFTEEQPDAVLRQSIYYIKCADCNKTTQPKQ